MAAPALSRAATVAVQPVCDEELFAAKIAGEVGPDVQVIALVENYLERALDEAPFIGGRIDLLRDRFAEAASIYSLVQTRLQELQPTIRFETGFATDPNVPFVTFDQFLAAEEINFSELSAATSAVVIAAGDAVRKGIAKLLGVLGLHQASQAFFELLEEDGLIAVLDNALVARNLKAVGKVFGQILDKFVSTAFLKRLGHKIGLKAAAKIVGKITARFVPFLGWAILIGSVLWAVGEQLF